MKTNIKEIIHKYEENKEYTKKYKSYINEVREYNGYIFKENNDIKKVENESKWLKKLIELNYCTPKIVDTYKNIIIMEKIEGQTIKDDNATEHLYNIGQLMAKLHNIPIETNSDWKKTMISEYIELRDSVKYIMENDIFEAITKFIESELEKIKVSRIGIIHKDLRPENVIYSDSKYYLLDLESMGVGDIDYDFTRILNLLNEKEIYQYEDFKKLIDGYNTVTNIKISEEKWQLYNKFYAFRIYSKMLTGKINRSSEYERYLKNILITNDNRVTEWIRRYNCGGQ